MFNQRVRQSILGLAVITVFSMGGVVMAEGEAGVVTKPYLSANIPLDSYIYDYLGKLSGLGYLKMPTGTKPYTRFQVAAWIREIDRAAAKDHDLPDFAAMMLERLRQDLSSELAGEPDKFALREAAVTGRYYNGTTLPEKRTNARFQPLNTNNNGYRLDDGASATATIRVEGSLSPGLFASVTPRYGSGSDTSIESGYIKTHINNLAIQVGKDAMWWGQGLEGSRSLTNNAAPLTSIKLSNIAPVKTGGIFKFLGSLNTTFFYSELESDRAPVKYPSFTGLRMDFSPTSNFTFSLNRLDIVGGAGHMLNRGDFGDFITGRNADKAADEKWNSQCGVDFRWRIPQLHNIQVYGEVYGEDQAHFLGVIPAPSELSELFGVYFPRLSADGSWDAHIEWAHTRQTWYAHTDYAWTYKGNILGDAMGSEANRYYLKLSHWSRNASELSFNFERLVQYAGGSIPQTINAVWLSGTYRLNAVSYLRAKAGVANISNVNFQAGAKDRDYLTELTYVQQF